MSYNKEFATMNRNFKLSLSSNLQVFLRAIMSAVYTKSQANSTCGDDSLKDRPVQFVEFVYLNAISVDLTQRWHINARQRLFKVQFSEGAPAASIVRQVKVFLLTFVCVPKALIILQWWWKRNVKSKIIKPHLKKKHRQWETKGNASQNQTKGSTETKKKLF